MVDQALADEFAETLGFSEYAACVPVGSRDMYMTCDGVGTKVMVADTFEKWDTIGIDLVAMCINDLLACGAKPLAFMDYYAVEKLDIHKAKEILLGVRTGCELAGCSLVGGETAQMRGLFASTNSWDIAGFALGEVRQRTRIHSKLQVPNPGDHIIGIPSSGFHSNGYTCIRENLRLEEWMLKPTRIYTQEVLPNLHKIKRCAHVTGGGIIRAMKRLLPEGRQFNIEVNPPPIYDDFNMSDKDLMSTFNCGYGMLIITNTLDLDIPDMELIGEVC